MLDEPREVRQLLPHLSQQLLIQAVIGRQLAEQFALVPLEELVWGDEAGRADAFDGQGHAPRLGRPAPPATPIGVQQSEAADLGVRLEGGSRQLEPSGGEGEPVLDPHQVLAGGEVKATVEAAVRPRSGAGVEDDARDPAAAVLAHEVVGDLIVAAAGHDDELVGRRRVPDAVQRSAHGIDPVVSEEDDTRAAHP